MNAKSRTINIAKEFSETPWGRFPDDGDYCGENFRKIFLVPALKENDEVTISLDGLEGLGSSFMEEAFGGLIRLEGFHKNELGGKLKIVSSKKDFEIYISMINKYLTEAKPKNN